MKDTRFIAQVRASTSLLLAIKRDRKEQVDFEVGRSFATQFIDALRAPDPMPPGALILAVAAMGLAGTDNLQGFLTEIAEELKEPS